MFHGDDDSPTVGGTSSLSSQICFNKTFGEDSQIEVPFLPVEITINERTLILEGPMFHFHDYGRKGRCIVFNNASITSLYRGCLVSRIAFK